MNSNHLVGLEQPVAVGSEADYGAAHAPLGAEQAASADHRVYDHPALQRAFVRKLADGESEAALVIHGIHCAGCIARIENALNALPGVAGADVHFVTHQAKVRFDGREIPVSGLFDAIAGLGFKALPYDPSRRQTDLLDERREALRRIGVAAALGMQVMVLAVALYGGDFWGIEAQYRSFFRYVSLALTVPLLAYCGRPFLSGALRDLKARSPGMDTPITLGLGLAFLASTYTTLAGEGRVYFDSIAMFVFLVLGARYLELAQRVRASAVFDRMLPLLPDFAQRIPSGDMVLAAPETVPTVTLVPGDLVLVRPGESIPADGEIVAGRSSVNEALLSGESLPIFRGPGDAVIAGAINIESALTLRVTQSGADTAICGIERLVQRAQAERAPTLLAADRIAKWFVAGVLLLAAAVAAFWWYVDPARWLDTTIAVLIVTCPCALSLATPAAFVAASTAALREGLLVARGGVFERLNRATHFVFDKTGTLTFGEFVLEGIRPLADVAGEDCLALAAALERHSEHPLATALLAAADNGRAVTGATEVENHVGAGLRGRIRGERYSIGRPDFALARIAADEPPGATHDDMAQTTTIVLASASRALCEFTFRDRVRPEAQRLVDRLKADGKAVILATGDHSSIARALATELGIPSFHAECSPGDKLALVRRLKADGATVAVVGDGVNDAPVIGAADASIAMGNAANIAVANADMVVIKPQLDLILAALRIARDSVRVITQNLHWALGYNIVAIPAAAAGWIPPWAAAIGMSLSSAIVILNASRLARSPRAVG